MVKIEQFISGISEYLKAKLYPALDSASRMKVSSALYIAKWNPQGTLAVLLSLFVPTASPEKALDYAKTIGVMDTDGNIDADMLLGMAKAHVVEFGELNVSLFGIEFDLGESNIAALGEYIKASADDK